MSERGDFGRERGVLDNQNRILKESVGSRRYVPWPQAQGLLVDGRV